MLCQLLLNDIPAAPAGEQGLFQHPVVRARQSQLHCDHLVLTSATIADTLPDVRLRNYRAQTPRKLRPLEHEFVHLAYAQSCTKL